MSSRRHARLQVDADSIPDDDKPPQTGHTFNLWYLKWAGGDSSTRHQTQSKFRVNIKRDSGSTRAVEGRSPICLFFARGCCYKGRKCPYLHRLPQVSDSRVPTQDCFGRDKTAEYRDDMGGVGSLHRKNRTLYVSGAHMSDLVQEKLHKQFSEFGDIDKIRVLPAKNCAFVSYRLEAEAQFAKEAMDCQTLDGKDVLTIKWANDDPNPHAQQSEKRDLEQAAMDTVRQLLGNISDSTSNKRKQDPVGESSDPLSKRRQIPDPKPSTPISISNDALLQDKVNGSDEGILDFARLNALKKLHTASTKSSANSASTAQRVNKIGPAPGGFKPLTSVSSMNNTEMTLPSKANSTAPGLLAGYSSSDESD